MIELLAGFTIFMAIMAILTLVGHGIWVLLALILRTVFGVGQSPDEAASRCPECGHSASLVQGICDYCGYRSLTAQRNELETTIQLIRRLHSTGVISDRDYQGVARSLQAEVAKLRSAGISPGRLAELAPARHPATGQRASELPPRTAAASPTSSDTAPAGQEPSRPVLEITEDGVLDAEVMEPAAPSAPDPSPFAPSPQHAPPVHPEPTVAPAQPPHPLDAPDPKPAAATAPTFSPRRTMANMLQTFMEEKNIRWGELASGMLIVGSAIGLVVSLRAELERLSDRIPYFSALLLMLGTVAIHGAGLYTLRRWKLRSTSRGVLIIATLLVPLSFAAGIILNGTGDDRLPVTSPIYLAAVLVGMLGYGAVTSLSARALFPEGWWRLTVAVMGTSAGQLVINRLGDQSQELWTATAVFAVSLVSYLVATSSQLRVISLKRHLTPARAAQTFTVLGIAAFALAVPLVLQAGKGDELRTMLRALSPSLSVAAAVILGIGIAVQRRCESKSMGDTRTAGTALALLGGMMMLGTVVTAWPEPVTLIAVATVTAIVLALLAVIGRLPILHAGTAAAASFAGLLLYHHATGQFSETADPGSTELIRALLMGRSSIVLMVPALLSGIAGLLLVNKQQRRDGLIYLASAAGIATTSLAIAFYAGFWSKVDADWTTLIFLVYAVTALVIIPIVRRQEATCVASAALLIALVHLYTINSWFDKLLASWQMSPERPLLLAVLIHALVVAVYSVALAVRRQQSKNVVDDSEQAGKLAWLKPLPLSGALAAGLTVPFILYVPAEAIGAHGAYAACVAVVWAITAWLIRDAQLATAAHAAATVSIGFVTAAIAKGQDWADGLYDLRHWQLQISVLGIWCIVSTATRLLTRRWEQIRELLKPNWPTVDQVLVGALVIAILYVGVTGCWIGANVELGMLDAAGTEAQDGWHQVAYGGGSWLALGCVLGSLALLLHERVTAAQLAGLVAATAVIPLLISGGFENSHAVATAMRWSFAIFTLFWTGIIAFRDPIKQFASRAFPSVDDYSAVMGRVVRDLATLAGIFPVAFLTTLAVSQFAQGATFNGPAAGTFFGQMSIAVCYATPLALLVAGALVIAVRDGSAPFAILGSVLLQYVVALGVLLPTLKPGSQWTLEVSVELAQWSACSLAAYAIAWLGLSKWIDRHTTDTKNWLFEFQLIAASTATLVLACWSVAVIFDRPAAVDSIAHELGLWPSYVAASLAFIAAGWHFRRDKRELALLGVVAPCVFTTLIAATCAVSTDWLEYHLLTGGFLAVAVGTAAVGWWQDKNTDAVVWLRYLSRAGTVVASTVLVLLVRGCVNDPIAPWWTLGTALGLFLYFASQAIRLRRQRYAYLSALVGVFATSVLWCHLSTSNDEEFFCGFVYSNIIAASLIGLFWLMIELWHESDRGESLTPNNPLAPVQAFLAIAGTATMSLVVVGLTAISLLVGLASSSGGLAIADPWGLAALISLGLLLTGLLWEKRIGLSLVATYLWGFVCIALVVSFLQQSQWLGTGRVAASWLIVAACVAGAAYIALTGHVWRWGANIAQWATRLQIPSPIEKLQYISRWLPAFNLINTFVICGLGFITIFTRDSDFDDSVFRPMRMTVAFAPVLLAYGVSCLAQQHRKFPMQLLSLFLVVVGAVFIGWADVDIPAGDAGLLAYSARLLVVLAGMTLLYSMVVARWIDSAHDWFNAVRRSSVILAISTVGVLAIVLLLELALFEKNIGAPIATPEVIAISVMLFGFLAALLSMAVLPGRDPLELTEKGRQGYVYAAQAMAALLFAHIYLAKPQLLQFGIMRNYWPYVVMAIAFASVAFSEFCHRKGWQVIAEPMQRTGGFLPLLPALTAWMFAGPERAFSYPLTLFFAGLIYVFMSISRRSFVAGIAAAVMGNGALWALLKDADGFQLTDHPQLWLIPPALSVLGASYINKDRLSGNSLTAIRYICVMIVYLSSTGEMFMHIMAQEGHWAGPLILTALSVAGIFAGIMLRVRAFLYLGSSFLLMSIVGMVRSAQMALGHFWPWWAFGITMGIFILVLFGLFEKYRQETQQLITRLRQWEP